MFVKGYRFLSEYKSAHCLSTMSMLRAEKVIFRENVGPSAYINNKCADF